MSEGRARSVQKGVCLRGVPSLPPPLGPCAARLNTVFREESFDSLRAILYLAPALTPSHTHHMYGFDQFTSDVTTGGCEQRTERVEGLCDL